MLCQRIFASFIGFGLLLAGSAVAQPSFRDVSPPLDSLFNTPASEDFWLNAAAPADVDGDGDLDLAVLGYYVVYNVSAVDRLVMLLNDGPDVDGNWTYTQQEVDMGGLFAGASDLAWGDFDGDGDPDLAVGTAGETVIFRNDAGSLSPLSNSLPGYWEDSAYSGSYDLRSLTWADSDNDGDLDLLVPSVFDFDLFEWNTHLVRNDGSDGAGGWLFTDVESGLDPTVHAQSAWADDDGDEDLDLFLTNIDPHTDTGFIRLYRNDGGTFVGEDLLGIRIEYGLADWGDYDADGDMDILVVGNIQEVDQSYNTVLRIYENTGGAFSENTLVDTPSVDWLDLHAATWADYDSDGDVDLLVTGSFVGDGEIVGHSKIWGNDGGVFSDLGVELPAPVSSVGRGGAFNWFDIDNDGDLDYFVGGAYYVPGGNGLVEAQMHIFLNEGVGENAAPFQPLDLLAIDDGDAIRLSWSPSADDHTVASALTYDLEIRPSGGTGAPPGAHQLPEHGNLSAVTSWSLRGLQPGTYDWFLRTVDSAFNASAAAQGTFEVGATAGDLGGRVGGVTSTQVKCLNRDTGQRVMVSSAGNSWSCSTAGLVAESGSRVVQKITGTAGSGGLRGQVFGLQPSRVSCRNSSTGVTTEATVSDRSWECSGLAFEPGDTVVQLVSGSAD